MKIPLMTKAQNGLSMIEVMITLLLTSISAHLIYKSTFAFTRQLFKVVEVNDLALKSQQLAYWFRHNIGRAGQYNRFDSNNKLLVSWKPEQRFIKSHPIALTGSYKLDIGLGSVDAKTDRVVINYLANNGCNGQKYHYNNHELFHVVDEIYLENSELRCRSYDGRYLTGKGGNKSSFRSVGLMQGVELMQVKYLVRHNSIFSFVDATELDDEGAVKAVKIELWIKDVVAKRLQVSKTYHSWLTPDSFESHYKYKRVLLVIPLTGHSDNV